MSIIGGMTQLLFRRAAASALGQTFGGARNFYEVFGYKKVIRHNDYLERYLRQDITQRVINAPVSACWSDPPSLRIGSADGKEWEEWKALTNETNLYAHVAKADRFAGLGAYAILLIGLDDGRALDQPVNKARKNKIIYMQPYLEGSINITKFETDQKNPRFGQPITYEVTPGAVLTEGSTSTTALQLRNKFTVHYSRVLHLADNTLENTIIGHSRLEPIVNLLDDIIKVAGGAAETFWLTANRGLQVNVDKDMELDDKSAEDLAAEFDEYQHQLRRIVRTRGVEVKNLGSEVADPRGAFSVLMALLSAQTGIPQRVLMGAEAGQLASQQDRANWAIRVAERTSEWTEPFILKPLLLLLQEANVITIPEKLYINWADPFKMNPLERAQTSAQMARSAVNVIRSMKEAQEMMTDLITIEEARQIIAPGDKMPILTGKPSGTLPPSITKVDPQKFAPTPTTEPTTPASTPAPNTPAANR